MDGKGWLAIAGGLAGLWAWKNPDKAWQIVDGLARWSEQDQQRRALQAAPPPALPPPPPQPPPALALPDFGLAKMLADLRASPDGPAVKVPAYTPPVDEALARLLHHPAVVLILGHRGSSKSALAVRL
jgi:hypothetical protein